jgi:glutathione S-transferase
MADKLRPLTLHAHSTGPNPYKIAIALEILSLPYEVRLWDFGDDPQNGVKGKAFLAINENGRVPALQDPNTGVVSWESGAVMNYLLRNYDKKNSLGPRGDSEQDRVDLEKWTLFLLTGLAPMMGQTNWYRHYNPVKNEDALKRYEAQTYRHFDVLESQLTKSGGRSILKGGFSAADVHTYPWINQYEYAGVSLDNYPTLKKWYEEVGKMKEVKKGYETVPNGKKD